VYKLLQNTAANADTNWLESLSSHLMNWKPPLLLPLSLPTYLPCKSVRLLYTVVLCMHRYTSSNLSL